MTIVGRIISGGQTGADQGGLRAARRCGIATGGTAPRGYRTETGPRPRLLKGFGLIEHSASFYAARTRANVENADLTLVVARRLDRGSALTVRLCRSLGRPVRIVAGAAAEVGESVRWLCAERRSRRKPLTLNLAGNRESREPGIGARTEKFLTRILRLASAPHGEGQ